MPRSHGTSRPLPAYDLAVRAAADPAQPAGADPLVDRIRHYKQLANFPAFCQDHLKIRTKQAEHVPLAFNRAQRFLWESHLRPALETGQPLWIYLLKARQLGWTTLFQALGYWRTSLWPNVRAFTGAHDERSVRSIFEINKLFYKLADPAFRPTEKISNRTELHFANPSDVGDLGLESFAGIAPATSENLGASQTIQFAHLSEFCLYDQRSVDVPAMLTTFFQTIAAAPLTLVALETTARQGYGKDFWEKPNRFTKVFVSWLADADYTEPVPLAPADLRKDPRGRYGDELRAREDIVAQLAFWYPERAGDDAWFRHESLCRLRWRRTKIDEHVDDGGLVYFRREYPLTPDEAFSFQAAGVYDSAILLEQRDAATARAVSSPPALYRFDRDAPAGARLTRTALEGDPKDATGLLVYEAPRKGCKYALGADPGGGYADGDPSALSVRRLGEQDLKGNTFQVARFTGQIGPVDLARLVDEVGRWYNVATVIPEASGLGVALCSTLAHDLRYPNLFLRQQFDEITQTYSEKLGFATTSSTKPFLISMHQAALADGRVILRDLASIAEHLAYTAVETGRSKTYGAPRGLHDDLVMSDALVTFGADYVPVATDRRAKRPVKWWLHPPNVVGVEPARRDVPAAMF